MFKEKNLIYLSSSVNTPSTDPLMEMQQGFESLSNTPEANLEQKKSAAKTALDSLDAYINTITDPSIKEQATQEKIALLNGSADNQSAVETLDQSTLSVFEKNLTNMLANLGLLNTPEFDSGATNMSPSAEKVIKNLDTGQETIVTGRADMQSVRKGLEIGSDSPNKNVDIDAALSFLKAHENELEKIFTDSATQRLEASKDLIEALRNHNGTISDFLKNNANYKEDELVGPHGVLNLLFAVERGVRIANTIDANFNSPRNTGVVKIDLETGAASRKASIKVSPTVTPVVDDSQDTDASNESDDQDLSGLPVDMQGNVQEIKSKIKEYENPLLTPEQKAGIGVSIGAALGLLYARYQREVNQTLKNLLGKGINSLLDTIGVRQIQGLDVSRFAKLPIDGTQKAIGSEVPKGEAQKAIGSEVPKGEAQKALAYEPPKVDPTGANPSPEPDSPKPQPEPPKPGPTPKPTPIPETKITDVRSIQTLDDAYKVFGLDRQTADERSLKVAYRKLSLGLHPDYYGKNSPQDRARVEEAFKKMDEWKKKLESDIKVNAEIRAKAPETQSKPQPEPEKASEKAPTIDEKLKQADELSKQLDNAMKALDDGLGSQLSEAAQKGKSAATVFNEMEKSPLLKNVEGIRGQLSNLLKTIDSEKLTDAQKAKITDITGSRVMKYNNIMQAIKVTAPDVKIKAGSVPSGKGRYAALAGVVAITGAAIFGASE